MVNSIFDHYHNIDNIDNTDWILFGDVTSPKIWEQLWQGNDEDTYK
jgi:hypothetical protein